MPEKYQTAKKKEIERKKIDSRLKKATYSWIIFGLKLGTDLRLDLFVDERVIIDLKAKEFVPLIDRQKRLSYLRLSHKKPWLIINFHVVKLEDGVERIVNGLAD